MDVEAIITAISRLDLKDTLKLLAGKKILDLGKKGYESIRKLIQDKTAEKKFGFVPNKEENDILKKVAEREYYLEFGSILPNHHYSDLIRVGYLVAHLNKSGKEVDRVRGDEIRGSIRKRPNGVNLIKIVYLVTTGAIAPVVDYLSDLKKKKYENDYILNAFDEIIIEWKKYAYFVKKEITEKIIVEIITHKMRNKQKLIMIFSYGSAKRNCTLAVAQLLKDQICEDYFYESKNNQEGDKEVHSSTFTLMDSV